MRIDGFFVLCCRMQLHLEGTGLALSVLSRRRKKHYFIHPVSFHSSGHCSVAKTWGLISTKILINGEGDVNELEWRAVTWAQWGRDKNTESWPWYWTYTHSAVQKSQAYGFHKPNHCTHRTATFKQRMYCWSGFLHVDHENNLNKVWRGHDWCVGLRSHGQDSR